MAAFFIFQNVLGLFACARIKRYILAVGDEIVSYEQSLLGQKLSPNTRDVIVPSSVYARAIQLMMLGLGTIAIMWIVLALLLAGAISSGLSSKLMALLGLALI